MNSILDFIRDKYGNEYGDFYTMPSDATEYDKIIMLTDDNYLGIKFVSNMSSMSFWDIMTNFTGFNKITIGDANTGNYIDFDPEYFNVHALPVFMICFVEKKYDYEQQHSFDVYALNNKIRKELMQSLSNFYYKFDDNKSWIIAGLFVRLMITS